MTHDHLEAAAHVVQLALTPVFLLSGIAALMNVFASRLARVADQVDSLNDRLSDAARDRQLGLLTWRSRLLDAAVVLSALGGALTCATVLDLFLGEVRWANAAALLFPLFGSALLLTMASLTAFVGEVLLATRGVRLEAERKAST